MGQPKRNILANSFFPTLPSFLIALVYISANLLLPQLPTYRDKRVRRSMIAPAALRMIVWARSPARLRDNLNPFLQEEYRGSVLRIDQAPFDRLSEMC